MFRIIKRQILVSVREKSALFWTLIFPLILATLFHFTLEGMMSRHSMGDMEAALVMEASGSTQEKENFRQYLQSLDVSYIRIEEMSKEEAAEALKNDRIDGIFYAGEERSLTVGEDSVYTGILSQVLEMYERNRYLLERVGAERPEKLGEAVSALTEYKEATKTVDLGGKSIDNIQNYFFALVAMSCLYGSFLGMYNTVNVQANTSSLGARMAAGCLKRWKTITASLISAWILSFGEVLVLLFYLQVILGDIHAGEDQGKIIFICLVATLCAASLGMLVGTAGSWGEKAKNGFLVSLSMTCSFLADLMVGGVKSSIEQHVPIVNRINPGALITDAFYSVLVYDDQEKYIRSLACLALLALVMLAAAIMSMRRMRYESI